MDSTANSTRPSEFKLDFVRSHAPPCITKGRWFVESDGTGEFEIVDSLGMVIAHLEEDVRKPAELRMMEIEANAQCISLVPELVRGVYVAMRALRGTMPDDQSPESIANMLSDLLKRTYSSPPAGE